MGNEQIAGYIGILQSAINCRRDLSDEQMRAVASAGLKLVEGLLLDVRSIAESLNEIANPPRAVS